MSRSVILASGSASRRALLANAGVVATAVKPNVDEDTAKVSMRAEGLSVAEQAMALAEMKALAVSPANDGLVIGGDQILALGRRAFDKPDGLDGVRQHLRDLSGQTHTLETAIAVADKGLVIWRHLAQPQLTMRSLSDDFIDHYVSSVGEDACRTVGGYMLEGLGSQLFSKIEGDYFSILGLPLLPLLEFLRGQKVVAR